MVMPDLNLYLMEYPTAFMRAGFTNRTSPYLNFSEADNTFSIDFHRYP